MRTVLIFVLAIFFTVSSKDFLFAQKRASLDQKETKAVVDIKKIQAEMKEKESKFMDDLKKQNPKLYEQITEQKRRQEERMKIIQDYRNKVITYEAAKSKLFPLIQEETRFQLNNIDNEIAMLENRLAELKKAKRDPNYLIDQNIDRALGKSSPEQLFPHIQRKGGGK